MLSHYTGLGRNGAVTTPDHLEGLRPAPHPRHETRKQWDPPAGSQGPIGLLIHSMELIGAAVDDKFSVRSHGEASFNIGGDSKQVVHSGVFGLASRAWTRAADGMRKDIAGLQEIDRRASLCGGEELSREHMRSIKLVQF